MTRTLAKRLQRLETRALPATEPLVIEVEFISAIQGSVTKRMTVTCGIPCKPGTRRGPRA